jgi:EAL domain-containing protein (putative c-di-GMP-specific phosphodiesterase class I)
LGAALADAQTACRLAKDRGRNRVEMFSGRERAGARAPVGIIDYVALALERDWFELLAQPILPLGGIPADLRFEILLRMRAADGSRLSFGKLLGAAPAHLMRDIDRWVIEHALTRLSACREVLGRHPARFSLNVSAASLADAQFWYWLEERLRASRLEPGTVAFEFPEEAAGQLGGVAGRMMRLREQGVAFALDNFGRDGALARMRLLPVSCIKIDGSLTRSVSSSSRSRSTVLAICELAKSSGLETIAAQVETDAVRAAVQALGVEYGQGFFIGKPLALDEALGDLPLYGCFSTSTGLFDTIAPKHASSGS